MTKTFEQYLQDFVKRGIVDFSIRASIDPATGNVQFYIHPAGVSGETLDLVVVRDTLVPQTTLPVPEPEDRDSQPGEQLQDFVEVFVNNRKVVAQRRILNYQGVCELASKNPDRLPTVTIYSPGRRDGSLYLGDGREILLCPGLVLNVAYTGNT